MYIRKLALPVFAALLGASFVQDASAWGTGGAVTTPRKAHLTGYNLFCDLSRSTFGGVTIPDGQRARIETLPSKDQPTAQASFNFSGEMFCAEIDPNTVPSLEAAVDLDPGAGDGGDVGRFLLTQVDPKVKLPDAGSPNPADRPGLQYGESTDNGVKTRTWTFAVPSSPTFPFPELLYELTPLDAKAEKFCELVLNCKALFGLQIPAMRSDYPARSVDGQAGDDLNLGEVFKFSTIEKNGVEAAGKFFWGVCHSQAFVNPLDVTVKAIDHSSTRNDGEAANGLNTMTSWSGPLAITTNQNDLWNSGVVMPRANPPVSNCHGLNVDPACRWSNADGQSQVMIATGVDDSGLPASLPYPIGVDATDWTQNSKTLPVGRLVGQMDFSTSQFFDIGVAKNYSASTLPFGGGSLSLYYWDLNNNDNEEEIAVRLAEKSIQCVAIVNGDEQRVSAEGNARGLQPVPVAFSPSPLNVTNTSSTATFPGAISSSADVPIGPDGSPIIAPNGVAGTSAFIDGHPVQLFDFTRSGSKLNLKFKNFDVIAAVTPGGTCQNGTIIAKLEIGSDATGYFSGEAPIILKNCHKL